MRGLKGGQSMVTNNMLNIGAKIKHLREASKITQTQLADFLSVDQSLVSKIEKGERSISSDMLSNIAILFCYPLSKLLTEDEVKPTYNIAFRTNTISNEDLRVLFTINKIALNQFKMDQLAGGIADD